MPNLPTIFITGLVTGGITCMAVQGGLLASVIAAQDRDGAPSGWRGGVVATLWFVGAKMFAYTALGALLGWLGSMVQLTPMALAGMMAVASLFMIATALNLLNVHPIFRYAAVTPPRFLTRLIRQEARGGAWFAPALVGAFTVFIPCGTTQAMMAAAIATAHPLWGALTMLAFTAGTVPLFVLFGVILKTAATSFTRYFAPVAATLVIVLAVWNIRNAAAVGGIDTHIAGSIRSVACASVIYCENGGAGGSAETQGRITDAPVITIRYAGYDIDNPNIRAGSSVHLTVKNEDGAGCIQAFTIPSLGIQKIVPPGQSQEITFTAPEKKGELAFMCSMGMYRGRFVIQ